MSSFDAPSAPSNATTTRLCRYRAPHHAPFSDFIKVHYNGAIEQLTVCGPCRTIRQAAEKRRYANKKAAAATALVAAGTAPLPPPRHTVNYENVPAWRVNPLVLRPFGVEKELPLLEKNFGFEHVDVEMAEKKAFGGKECGCGCHGGPN